MSDLSIPSIDTKRPVMLDASVREIFSGVDSLMSYGITTLLHSLGLLNEQARDVFEKMELRQQATRDVQNYANEIDSVLGDLIHDTDTGPLPDDVYQYMKTNEITVRGKKGEQTLDEFLADKSRDKLDKGQLNTIKTALEAAANRASDIVSSSQLKVQRLTQTYSAIVTLIGSLQSAAFELISKIFQAIRG